MKKSKFKTTANFVVGEKADRYAGQGLIHKAVNLQTRVTGDKPSVTKSLKSLQPKIIQGKALKKSAQFANFMTHDAVQTAVNLALASETASLKTGQAVRRNVKYKLKQKYRQEAIDDYHRGTIATLGIAADAVKGTRSHFKQKKAFRLEKARYKVKKAEYKLFMDEQYKSKLAKSRSALKNAKKDFQERKLNFKQFQKSHANSTAFTKNVHQTLYRKRKQQYKLESKSIKTTSKSLKKDRKLQRKIKQKQWRIADLSAILHRCFSSLRDTQEKS
ncbi:MAG: hypothetical protein LUG26_04680 [Ruminococcus sp.]|nr:hypothetical protein [Ruminococcus sp.]